MKTILVATDFSPSSESALKYAAFVASFTKADIVVFNNFRFDIHSLNGLITASAMESMVKKNQQKTEDYAAKMALKYSRPIKAFSLTSMTAESLEELIEKVGANLIVMGMRTSNNEYHLSGITSNMIVENVKVPVLVVPEKVELKMPDRVLYAYDYHSLPKDEHLNVLKEVAKAFSAELQVFHVYNPESINEVQLELRDSLINEIESAISSIDHSYRDVKAKNFIEGLKSGIKDFNADILVMSPHKYGFWNSLIHKSKTREMVLTTEIPLLSIPS